MPYKCFFSYARDNADEYLETFFNDLREEIHQYTSLPPPEILFRDTRLETGDNWDERLKAGLATSDALICLVSPTYVGREFCGKEFQIFTERVEAAKVRHARFADPPPSVILPILWIPVKSDMPQSLDRLQHYNDDYPSEYKTEGLRYLLRLGKQEEYRDFLHRFVERVQQVTPPTAAALPPLDFVREFADVTSAFHVRHTPSTAPTTEQDIGGPNSVKFVFVAAKSQEIQPVKQQVQCYDSDGGWFWRPFDPPEQLTVGRVAQQVASDENLRYNEIPLDSDIVTQLQLADERKEIIVIVVDVWSIRLQTYQEVMRHYDAAGYVICAVLIIWNEQDDETQQNLQAL